ncbi:uncharacterized protein LOC124363121 [Homalodisca vitripennis]|uniref:uncharacterized protein LOC124363121 n=1 Tax=Homalodisca vitripennis TaxID=197043 RepID=UPI001EEA0909|nr:uncharacterized protein LOC124363121 [Homalodisca vitripennis]
METSRSLHKLFKLSFPKLLQQTNLSIQTSNDSQRSFSQLSKLHSFTFPYEFSTRNKKHCNCKCNQMLSANSISSYTQRILFPSVNPDILFMRNVNRPPLLLKKVLLKVNNVKSHNFSTTTNNRFWNKLIPFESQAHMPSKLFAHKAEMEQPATEGVGWAGQPIVKRVHSILPEVYGDVSDIFQPVKELENPKEGCKSRQVSTLTETSKDNPTQFECLEELSADCTKNEVAENVYEKSQKNVAYTMNPVVPEDVKSHVRSHDTISFINDSVKEKLTDKVLSKEMTNEESVHVISKHGENESKQKNIFIRGIKKEGVKIRSGSGFSKTGVVLKTPKKKMRKKTKVCSSRTGSALTVNKKRGAKKKREAKVFRVNKKNKYPTQLVLNQRTYTQPFQKNVLFVENRQLKTDTSSRYPVRQRTEICGEATTDVTKKLNEWKPEMCLVKKTVKTRRRTLVCASKIARDKKKRNLPKCVKPEKKVPPKVLICPPKLEDELAAQGEKCQKQEEVKIRKRTQVCKPVIIFGKEKTEIKVEKVIREKKVRKIRSRHTTICLPTDKSKKKKMSMN